jgi:hypothetical protein
VILWSLNKVQRERRRAGAKGYNYFVQNFLYYDTNLITLFDNLGTWRESSHFEFTGTAVTVLTTAQLAPATRTAVDNLLDSLSAIQLGFQHTLGVEDTYMLGTALERLYKCAVDDDTLTKAIETVKSIVRSSGRQALD